MHGHAPPGLGSYPALFLALAGTSVSSGVLMIGTWTGRLAGQNHDWAGLTVGIPLGVVAGHRSWRLFAEGLGICGGFVAPLPLVLLMVPAVILGGNAVAFWPARTVTRVSPARVLRAE